MKDNNLAPFVGIVAAIILFIGGTLGINKGRTEIKEEAIRAGAAYYTNDASGKPQFKWKECK
jgi:hypothetical protein